MTYIGGQFGALNTDGEGGGGSPVTYSAAYQKSTIGYKTDSLVLPQGALFVHIQCLDIGDPITVNGQELNMGETWSSEVFINEVDRTLEFVEEVTILSPGGTKYLFRVSYPASSPVNPNTL